MSSIVFATGGTTSKSRIISHDWQQYDFIITSSANKISHLFSHYQVSQIANCLSAGNLWGGFLFIHDICRLLNIKEFPFSSGADINFLMENIKNFQIDTIICLPSFAINIFNERNKEYLKYIKNIFYLGENFDNLQRKLITEYYPKILIQPIVYTTQESGTLGYYCPTLNDNEYHIFSHADITLNKKSEIIISIKNENNNYKLHKHNTNDIGEITEERFCSCGYHGKNIILKGRSNIYANIFGTSISIKEFINYISDNNKINNSDIQVCLLQNQYLSKIAILIDKEKYQYISEYKIKHPNFKIREIINDSDEFAIYVIPKKNFFKSKNSGKIKPFFYDNRIHHIDCQQKYHIKKNL